MKDKKQKLIEAAIAIFTEKGLEKTKISDIVKHAGVAQGTFYLYFPSKLAIMPAIAEEVVKEILAVAKKEVNSRAAFTEQLNQLVEVSFTLTNRYSEVIALTYAGLASSDYLTEWETIYEPYYEFVAAILEEAIQKKEMDVTLNPKQMARLIIGLTESAAEQLYLYDTKPSQQLIEEQQQATAEFIKRALRITT